MKDRVKHLAVIVPALASLSALPVRASACRS